MSGKVVKVSGPLVVATGLADANMSDVVRVGPQRLIGEILTMKGDTANIQVYEETSGLGPGAEVETTGAPMSVELGPGLLENIYDGIQRPLEKIMEREDTQKLPSDERALFAVATELEDIALNDEYFVSRNLYPNVDFYTGLIYRAIGFDPAMFTTLFALGRIPGWIAQYREMLADPNTKIGRPRQVYTGPVERDFVPMDER